jgi:hypothetical protein
MGLAGSPVKPMVTWLLNRNGQAITLNNKLKQAGVKTAKMSSRSRTRRKPLAALTFGDLSARHPRNVDRYWLARVGFILTRTLLITIPPPQRSPT